MKSALAAVAAPAAALLLSAPAFASDPEQAETEKVEKAKEEKKICRRVTEGMGSRRKVKVCLTREEWKNFNAEQRRRSN
ncbi:MAG: hypothetical protein QNJ15_00860 [Erythrobacter sp.]|nr:hypothetical protein [Erythrobacter sp.]